MSASRLLRVARTLSLAILAACSDKTPTTATSTPAPTPATGPLAGSPTAKAGGAIPDTPYTPDLASFKPGLRAMPGVPVSVNTVIVQVHDTATVAQVNQLLTSLSATIVAGIPATNGRGGLMFVRLPATTHAALDSALTKLRANAAVQNASIDVQMRDAVVGANGSTDAVWKWSDRVVDWAAGTWGLQAMRIPQLWNLDRQLPPPARTIRVGAVEIAADITHPGITGRATRGGLRGVGQHGTAVASVMVARLHDGTGIEGVLRDGEVAMQIVTDSGTTTSEGAVLSGLRQLLLREPNLFAVNVSLGFANPNKVDPDTLPLWQAEANARGTAMAAMLAGVEAQQPLPQIIVAAGNEGVTAKWMCGLNNAGLTGKHAAIIVVEANQLDINAQNERIFPRAPFSNRGAHISAPGQQVGVAQLTAARYGLDNGTSFAAPYVAAVVAYLYRLAPDLPRPTATTNVVRDLLVTNGALAAMPDDANRRSLDAFAAIMAVDTWRNADTMLRKWLDIDDGTLDGNLRINPFTNAPDSTENPQAEAEINMADFRRLRDALLRTDTALVVQLDGQTRPKGMDLNGDGRIESPVRENFHPYGDLNGDGIVSRTATRRVAGALSTQGPLTDLQVLTSRFSDSLYSAGELPDLIESGDLHLRASGCPVTGTDKVRIQALRIGTTTGKFVTYAPTDSQKILTLPVDPTGSDYLVSAFRLTTDNVFISRRDTIVRLNLGQDIGLAPGCGTPGVTSVAITPSGTSQVPLGRTVTLTATPRNPSGTAVTGKTVVWASRNPSVATVTSGGVVTAVGAGTASISATVDGVTGFATILVPEPARPTLGSVTVFTLCCSYTQLPDSLRFVPTGGSPPITFTYPVPGARRFTNTLITISSSGSVTGSCLELCPTQPFGTPFPVLDSAEVILTESTGRKTTVWAVLRLFRSF